MHKFLSKNGLIAANIALVLTVKLAGLYPGFYLASLTGSPLLFSSQDIIRETNDVRQELGLGLLKESTVLDIAAAQKLQDMVQNQYFAHFSPEGISPWHWFELNRYAYSYAGENLAIGFLDAPATVQAWVNSPAHRKNLVNTHYQDIGVAVANAKIKDISGMIVVQFFGTPAEAPLGISLSRSGAAGIERTPTPTPTLSPSRAPAVALHPGVGAPAVPAATDADTEAPAPVGVTDVIGRLARGALNRVVIAYTLAIALAAIGYLIFRQARKDFLVKAAIHVVIFLLAAALPLIEMIRIGFIL